MVRIINIFSGKGGVGKTTVASNLAIGLQKNNKKTAVVDFNFTTPHLSLYFDLFSFPFTLNNFLRKEIELEDAIYNHPSGLSVVPASLDLSDIVNVDTSKLKETLRDVFWEYDFVILDSAPGLGREALISLKSCDEVIFVANPQIPSLVDIVKCMHVINSLESKPEPMGIIVNRVRGKKYEANLKEIREFTELPIIGVVPEDRKNLETENNKTLITVSNKNSPASKAFFNISAKLSGKVFQYSLWDRLKMSFQNRDYFEY